MILAKSTTFWLWVRLWPTIASSSILGNFKKLPQTDQNHPWSLRFELGNAGEGKSGAAWNEGSLKSQVTPGVTTESEAVEINLHYCRINDYFGRMTPGQHVPFSLQDWCASSPSHHDQGPRVTGAAIHGTMLERIRPTREGQQLYSTFLSIGEVEYVQICSNV